MPNKVEMIEHDDKIEVSKSVLDEIKGQIEELKKDNIEKGKTIEVLTKSVSKSKQDYERSKLEEVKQPRAFFKVYQRKPIVAWKSHLQTLEKSPLTGQVIGETMQGIFKLADGTETKPISESEITNIREQAWIRKKDERIDREYQLFDGTIRQGSVWIAEWEDSIMQEAYGDIEVPVVYLNHQ